MKRNTLHSCARVFVVATLTLGSLLLAGSAPAQSCTEPPDGILAWWPSEGNADDMIGTNHGALIGGVTFAQGEVGRAVSFSGSGRVVVPDAPTLRFSTNDFTIEAWIKTTSSGFGVIVGKQPPGSFRGIQFRVQSGHIEFLATDCNTGSCG
jgi:hypothetical protein